MADGANVIDYVNRGGRFFASHLSFTWLSANGTQAYDAANAATTGLGPAATWDTSGNTNQMLDLGSGVISVGRPQASPNIDTFVAWAERENIAMAPDHGFDIIEPRSQALTIGTSSEEFVFTKDTTDKAM